MSTGKFLDPKNDFLFKKLFGTTENQEILITFLNDVLNCEEGRSQIISISFLKPIQEPEAIALKQSIVDVLCQDQSGKQYIIEMQVARSDAFVKRAQYYAARAYSSQLQSGQSYSQLHEIIFIAITDFLMFPQKEQWKSDHVLLDNLSGERDLKDFYFSFIELPKFNFSIDQLSTRLEKWIYFIKHAEEISNDEMARLVNGEKALMRACNEVTRYNMTQIEMNTYEAELKNQRDAMAIIETSFNDGKKEGKEEGKEEGLQEGIQIGKEEGELIGIRKTAKSLKEEGFSVEMINKITKLSLSAEEVAAL